MLPAHVYITQATVTWKKGDGCNWIGKRWKTNPEHPSIHPHDWNVGMKLIFTGEEYGDRYAARTLLLNIQIIIEVCIVPENALFQKKH